MAQQCGVVLAGQIAETEAAEVSWVPAPTGWCKRARSPF